MLRAGNEVVEDVLFPRQVACAVPFFAEFAATAEVRQGKCAARIEPHTERFVATGREADAIASVTGEQHRIGAVERGTFTSENVERDLHAARDWANSRTTSMSSNLTGVAARIAVARACLSSGR